MPSEVKTRKRPVSLQHPAVSVVPDDSALSRAKSAGETTRLSFQTEKSEKLYLIGSDYAGNASAARAPQTLGAKETPRGTETGRTVIDTDIQIAKWAWAALVVAHCGLIFFMVHNLG